MLTIEAITKKTTYENARIYLFIFWFSALLAECSLFGMPNFYAPVLDSWTNISCLLGIKFFAASFSLCCLAFLQTQLNTNENGALKAVKTGRELSLRNKKEYLVLVLALGTACFVNGQMVFVATLILATNFLYFAPPFILRRFSFCTSFFLAMNYGALFLGGIYLILGAVGTFTILVFLGIYFGLLAKRNLEKFKLLGGSGSLKKIIVGFKVTAAAILSFMFFLNYLWIFGLNATALQDKIHPLNLHPPKAIMH